MRILEVILHRFKRLGFSGIETIHYNPDQDIQIIIGTNGSGKSSFMNELNPLPPRTEDMLLGGYKTFVATHEGKKYKLHSSYEKHNRHSFLELHEDGRETELNPGGTATAQKTLIERIFGVNYDIMKILIGRTTFTDMAPIKRRDWILKLSGNDLDYAMRLFNSAKQLHREAQTIEKHNVKRLAEESQDIADQERIGELETSVKRLTEELQLIMHQRENNIPSMQTIRIEMDKLLREFEDCSAEVMTLHLVKPPHLISVSNSSNMVQMYIAGLESRMQGDQEKLDELYKDKDKILDTLEALAASGVGGVQDLEKVNGQFNKEYIKLTSRNDVYEKIKGQNISTILGAFNSVQPILTEAFSTMFDNTSMFYTKQKVQDKRAEVQTINNSIAIIKDRMMRLQHQVEHYDQSHDINCPKCDFSFRPGLVQFNPEDAKRELINLADELKTKQANLDSANEYLTGAQEYSVQIKTLKHVIENNTILDPLWTILVEENLYRVAPISHLPTLQRFGFGLQECERISELEKKIEMNRVVLENAKRLTESQDVYNGETVQKLEQRIALTIDHLAHQKTLLESSRKYLKEITRAEECASRAMAIHTKIQEKHDLLLLACKNRALSELANTKQINLATANTALNHIARHGAVIEELERERDKAKENTADYHAIMKALSPVDGLISRYIQNFVDVFIADVNTIIDQVWTTKLEVLACGVDSTDVTCKFPLSIDNGYLMTPDISECSDGQRDIINFAFRMVVKKYLGLDEFPLYVDELAPTLDEAHRPRLTRYLSGIMEAGIYDQMFMISHYNANHSAFGNSEIFITDARNILTIPKEYNKHVKLVYSEALAA
jgi:hypothetical protein